MRLLNVQNLEFADFLAENERPKYVIASHRWIEGSEVMLQDFRNRQNTNKSGYKKIIDFAKYVQKHIPAVEWLWIDTCCINKENAAELSESINLMFDWYRNAELCVAYLTDVKRANDKSSLAESIWFKRGWTLQELLAPRLVIFLTEAWEVIGHKGTPVDSGRGVVTGSNIEIEVARITGIPELALHTFETSLGYSVEERLRWMEGRSTKREEDMSYALYGLFGVTPGANYGERRDGARQRLLAAIHYQDNLAAQRADRFQNIAVWLSPPDPWTNYKSARQLYEPQTGTWLLQSDQYREWKAASIRHLWIYGKPGCGKTVLCSTAIKDIKAYCELRPNAGYAIFFCSFSDNKKQHPIDLLRSLIVQLGWKGLALSMLQHAYEKPNRSIPGHDELENILLSCFQSYNEAFLLLDALDECPEDNDVQHSMLECLTRLSQKAHNIKIFATSRESTNIRALMTTVGAVSVSIAEHSINTDIRQYTAIQLSRDYRLSRLDQKTKTLIEQTISIKANGMFRWAYCQLQELKKLKSTRPKFVNDALYCLPPSLDKTYERMLVGIEDGLRTDALTLLRWLAYAKSPPSLGELADATVIDLTGDGNVDMEDRPGVGDTLEILSGLVTIIGVEGGDNAFYEQTEVKSIKPESTANGIELANPYGQFRSDTKVRLAHFSVKEYLESQRILQSDAKDFYLESAIGHRVLAQSCLIYLMHYSRSGEKLSREQDVLSFPLLEYAARTWVQHSYLQQHGTVSREVDFLRSEVARHDWLRIHKPEKPFEDSIRRSRRRFPYDAENMGSCIYYASFTGLEEVVTELLRTGSDVNSRGGYYGNALQAATFQGYEKILRTLLDAGAYVNACGGEYGTSLQAASYKGFDRLVQILITTEADVNAQGGKFGNALQAASYGNNKEVVQILLDAGADVNAQGGTLGNALQAASYGNNKEVVQMLLDAGASVNAQGGTLGNALQAASYGNNKEVVQMLLDAGADFNAQGGKFGNALQTASRYNNNDVVQMLLDAGANVNAKGGRYGNALQAASCHNNKEAVQMLLDAGADVNAQGGEYSNTLQAASRYNNNDVVQMLLDTGAGSGTGHKMDTG